MQMSKLPNTGGVYRLENYHIILYSALFLARYHIIIIYTCVIYIFCDTRVAIH